MNVTTFLWTDISHSQSNFESSTELSFKSVQNYFLIDKFFDTKLIKIYAHYIPNAMITDEMIISLLEFVNVTCVSPLSVHVTFTTVTFTVFYIKFG